MATIIEVTDLSMPELEPFTRLTEAQLRNRLEPEKGIFIAESSTVQFPLVKSPALVLHGQTS